MQEMQDTQVQSLGWEDLLEEDVATHSSILAWIIRWREECGGLQSMGLQGVRHDWMTEQARAYLKGHYWNQQQREGHLTAVARWHMPASSLCSEGLLNPNIYFQVLWPHCPWALCWHFYLMTYWQLILTGLWGHIFAKVIIAMLSHRQKNQGGICLPFSSFSSQLFAFDSAWMMNSYTNSVWKVLGSASDVCHGHC